jgi:hypothetical protein
LQQVKEKAEEIDIADDNDGMYIPFSSYYLLYLIDRLGFVVEDVTEMTIFYGNENGLFTEFTMQLMEERMKSIEQKNDGYRTFCKNILNMAYGKNGMNKSKNSKLVVMNKNNGYRIYEFEYN